MCCCLCDVCSLEVAPPLTLHMLVQVTAPCSSGIEPTVQVAVQATAVLRNLAIAPNHAELYLARDAAALSSLLHVASCLTSQQELLLNVSRVLSKLSLSEDCQLALEQHPQAIPLLLQLMQSQSGHKAALIRVSFVLGNLTTYSMEAREAIGAVDGALDVLVNVLVQYALPEHAANATHAHSDNDTASHGCHKPDVTAGATAHRAER